MSELLPRLCAIAALQPDAPAVVEHGRTALTYAELVQRAASLGARLRKAGAGPEQVIALAMPKSPEWVVAMLSTWWCGAAWMPLDPDLPAARRQEMLEMAEVRLAVTTPRFGHPAGLPTVVELRLDGPAEAGSESARDSLDALAYVIFTSGSSGAPKGVAVTHAGLTSMLDAQVAAFELGPGSRSLWVLSTAFDASVSDVGTALLAGAALHIEPPSSTPAELFEAIRRRAITYVDLPPSLLATMDPDDAPACLETVVIGGEPCPVDVVRRWARRVRLINVYGPTEASVCTSLGVCDADTWDRPLLGAPLPGVRYRVVHGELWIGGAQLARGYIGAPELSDARFSDLDGERMYRTGDRVHRRSDGGFEFLGRVDRQVKVRGMLVAPEEIESALLAHPDITRASVVKRPLGSREALVAFVERQGSGGPLATHLAHTLPAWMIPARFEHLERLPVTSAGKIDLRALEAHPLAPHLPRGRAPVSEAERTLAALFTETLGLDPLGCDDDFFGLGGDSLALVELVARSAACGLSLGPELLHRHSTIGTLAAALDRDDSSVMTMAVLRGAAEPTPALRLAIRAARSRPSPDSPPRHILLTGATGFLGSRLVRSLRARTDARIECLVRDPRRLDPTHGLEVVVGDIARARLGLSQADWSRLAEEVDTVVHCAALVSLASSYEELESANVGGTKEALRLACEARRASFHLASTLSVFVSTDRDEGVAWEDDDLTATREVYGGYAQSKVAAELVLRFAESALPIAQYRLGLLTGDRRDSVAPRNDWLTLLVRGLARIGAVPEDIDPDLAFDVTPVDHAAESMASLIATRPPTGSRTFHIAATRGTRFVALANAIREEGVDLEPVTSAAFLERLRSDDLVDAATLLALTRTLTPSRERRALDMFQATRIRFDDRNAREAGIVAPSPDPQLLRRYVRRMLATS